MVCWLFFMCESIHCILKGVRNTAVGEGSLGSPSFRMTEGLVMKRGVSGMVVDQDSV
jgi:hypothetical protein